MVKLAFHQIIIGKMLKLKNCKILKKYYFFLKYFYFKKNEIIFAELFSKKKRTFVFNVKKSTAKILIHKPINPYSENGNVSRTTKNQIFE